MKRRSKVVIVDDNPYSNAITKKIIELSKSFEEVQTFEDPLLAFAYLQGVYENDLVQEMPDLILVDLYMPEMSGWDFIHTFELLPYERAQQVDIKILTVSDAEEDRSRANALGRISAFLTKPFRIEMLMSTVDKTQVNKYSPL